MAYNIWSTYLNAPNRKKVHAAVGLELFGKKHKGKKAIIAHGLYGLKSIGAVWRATFANSLQNELGYHLCPADPGVWTKAMVKTNGEKFYSYLIVYVDDILAIDKASNKTIAHIVDIYRIREWSDE